MRPNLAQSSYKVPPPAPPVPIMPRPGPAELVQRCYEDGGIDGTALEWMLDHARLSREART